MKRILIALALALASATVAAQTLVPLPTGFNRLNNFYWKGECTGTLFMEEFNDVVELRPCGPKPMEVWVASDDVDLSHEFGYEENGRTYYTNGPSGERWGENAELDILFSFPEDTSWWNGTQTAWVQGNGQTGDLAMLNNGNGFNIYRPAEVNRYLDFTIDFDWAFGSEQFGTIFWFGTFTSFQYIDNGFPRDAPVSEPATLALLALGALGLAGVRSKRREHAVAK